MSLLTTLYWVLLVIALIFGFIPANPSRPWWPQVGNVIWIVLFILIGMKLFHTPLQ